MQKHIGRSMLEHRRETADRWVKTHDSSRRFPPTAKAAGSFVQRNAQTAPGSHRNAAAALAQLQAENAELRRKAVELALQIQLLRERRSS